MKSIALSIALVLPGLVAGAAPALAGVKACDIDRLSCSEIGNKCNIKFHNVTGRGSGAGGSKYNQASRATTIKVLAIKPNGGRAGENSLYILADQSGTLNLDKKIGFERIRIYSVDSSRGQLRMPCEDVKAVLQAGKDCKIFTHQFTKDGGKNFRLAYNCGVADAKSGDPSQAAD